MIPTVDQEAHQLSSSSTGQTYWDSIWLDVAKSAAWIKKHADEISIPDSIDFMASHYVPELDIAIYGIIITRDHNGKYRVGKKRAFGRGWPPDKTPLNIGDKLPDSFPVNVNIEWSGNSFSEFDFKELIKNKTHNFVFKAKEIDFHTDVDGSIVTYMSPKGATIHYNTDRIITQIEGAVFKKHHGRR